MSLGTEKNNFGFINLHTILPLVLVVIVIGGIGSYVITKSKASSVNSGSSGVVCTFKASPTPAMGTTSTYSVTMTNNSDSAYANASVQIGMRSGQQGGIIDSIDFGTMGPEQTKTLSKTIAYPTASTLNEIYFSGGTPTSDFSGCSHSFYVK